MRTIRLSALCCMLFTIPAIGCSDNDPTAPSLNIAGAWSGSASLPNTTSAGFTLQQTGSTISGTMRVSSAFPQGLTLTGTVDGSGRTFTWAVARGCEVWGGVLNIGAGNTQMNGAVVINRTGCQPAQSNGSGTVTVTRD